MTGNGGENVGGAGFSSRTRSRNLAARMHEPAIAHGREHEWKRKIEAQNRSAQTAIGEGYGMTRTKGHVIENSAILAQRDFAFGAAIEIIKNRLWNALTRDGTKIFDADNSGGSYRACASSHLQMPNGVRG